MIQLLTIKEAAKQLHVAPITAHRMSNDGRLPVVRLSPRIVRVDSEVLERMIRPNKNGEAA